MTVGELSEALKDRNVDFTMEQAGDLLIQHFKSYEYWGFIFDGDGAEVVLEMMRRHYPADRTAPNDCLAILQPSPDGATLLGAIALRKRKMLALHLQAIFRRFGIPLTERQILASNVRIVAAPGQGDAIADFCLEIFGEKFREWGATRLISRERGEIWPT